MFIVSPVVQVHSFTSLMCRDPTTEMVNSKLANEMYVKNNRNTKINK